MGYGGEPIDVYGSREDSDYYEMERDDWDRMWDSAEYHAASYDDGSGGGDDRDTVEGTIKAIAAILDGLHVAIEQGVNATVQVLPASEASKLRGIASGLEAASKGLKAGTIDLDTAKGMVKDTIAYGLDHMTSVGIGAFVGIILKFGTAAVPGQAQAIAPLLGFGGGFLLGEYIESTGAHDKVAGLMTDGLFGLVSGAVGAWNHFTNELGEILHDNFPRPRIEDFFEQSGILELDYEFRTGQGTNQFADAGGSGYGDDGEYGDRRMSVAPLVVDLDGDGVELVSLDESKADIDLNGDGKKDRVAWAGRDDGILVLDGNDNGKVDDIREFAFSGFRGSDGTDLSGLHAFDDNGDLKLTDKDFYFDRLLIWNDRNGDGKSQKGELKSLTELGITEIDLSLNGVSFDVANARIHNTTVMTRADGTHLQVWDVAFEYVPFEKGGGSKEQGRSHAENFDDWML